MMSAMGSIELTRVMPMHEALRLVMLGRHGRLTARRAYEIGFVNEIAPAAELRAAVGKLAEAVMQNAPAALRITKMALWEGLDHTRKGALDNARRIMKENPTTVDVEEGARAFVEKRKPSWKLR
jgi:enoyl-CoA hydratase